MPQKKIWQFFLQYDINGRIQGNTVQDIYANEISVFPNPTKDKLVVQGLTENITAANCRVFSVEGKQCSVHFCGNNAFDTSGLDNGIYFLQIETAQGKSVMQFVKL